MDLKKNLGDAWNEYVASVPKAKDGEVLYDAETGFFVNVISVQGFYEWLGKEAAAKEQRKEDL